MPFSTALPNEESPRSVSLHSSKQISVAKDVGSKKPYGAGVSPANENTIANDRVGLRPDYPKVTRLCSIRMSAASLCAGFIIVTAVCLLVTTFQFSMSAARAIAERHAISIASKAKNDVEALLSKPLGNIQGWQFAMSKGNYALPSDQIRVSTEAGDSSTLGNWQEPYFDDFVAALRASNFTYEFTVFGWNDGNYASCKRMPDQKFQCRTYYWGDRPSNGSGTSLVTDHNYFQNYTFINTQNSRTTYDPRRRSFFRVVNQTRFAMQWAPITLSAMPVLPQISLNGALFNDTHFLGVASISFELGVVSSFLSGLVTTENTVSLLIDNDDLLLASSYTNEPFLTRSLISRPYLSPVPTNCLTSDAANGASEDIMICRARVSSYSFAPLRLLAAREPELVAKGESGTARRLNLDGVDYFISVVPVVTPLASGMGWRFALFVPQNDIVGGIVEGRNIAIYISVAIIVVCIALCFVVLTLLLRPLSSVTDSMYKLATLQVDESAASPDGNEDNKKTSHRASTVESNLLEIAMIQCAFNVMSGELTKVKSFLPQSVLAQLYGSASSDEDNEEIGGEDDGVSRRCQTEDGDGGGGTSDGRSDSVYHTAHTAMYEKSSTDQETYKTVNNISKMIHAGKSKKRGNVAQLNTQLSLNTRRVTMLSMNLVGYHAYVAGINSATIVARSTEIVGAFSAAVNDHKGVLDGFQGDRFLASFNAVTAVGNHACAAAGAAISAGNALSAISAKASAAAAAAHSNSAEDHLLRMSSGIATSPAIVGNMGTQTVKRFTVLGPVVTIACALERLCKTYEGVQTLVAGSAVSEMENAFELMRCDVVELPLSSLFAKGEDAKGGAVGKGRSVVATLMGVKSALMDEWMYTLEAGERGSRFGAINDAFVHFMRGDNGTATTCLAKKMSEVCTCTPEPEAMTVRRLAALLAADVDGQTYMADMADYYRTVVVGRTQGCAPKKIDY